MSSDAEWEVISAAYRALMKKYHPDKNATNAGAAKARQINEAYAILGDPGKRATYDNRRRAGQSSQTKTPKSTGSAEPKEKAAQKPVPTQQPQDDPSPWKAFVILGGITAFCAAIAIASNGKSDELSSNTEADSMTLSEVPAPVVNTTVVPRKLSELEMLPVDFKHIERGASKFASVLSARGLIGARAYSEDCHKKVLASPGWEAADFCAAFDFAAVFVDEGVSKIADISANSYFKFKSENQDQDYAAAGADQLSLGSRLSTIRGSAQSVVSEAIDVQIAKSEAKRAREIPLQPTDIPPTVQSTAPANKPDSSELDRIFSQPPPRPLSGQNLQ